MATILVVDTNPIDRRVFTTLLGNFGHRLLEASDGAQALELARSELPDLVITSIIMPRIARGDPHDDEDDEEAGAEGGQGLEQPPDGPAPHRSGGPVAREHLVGPEAPLPDAGPVRLGADHHAIEAAMHGHRAGRRVQEGRGGIRDHEADGVVPGLPGVSDSANRAVHQRVDLGITVLGHIASAPSRAASTSA